MLDITKWRLNNLLKSGFELSRMASEPVHVITNLYNIIGTAPGKMTTTEIVSFPMKARKTDKTYYK